MTIILPVTGSPNWDVPLDTALLNLQTQAQAAQTTANSAVTTLSTKVPVDVLVFNVKDHGAVGNGSTDDTIAIQAAINLASTSGGLIYFPTGNYKISSSLTLASNIKIYGSGLGSTITQSSTVSDVFVGTDVQGIAFDSLKIVGPGTGTGRGIRLTISLNATTPQIDIRDMTISSLGGDAINISAPVACNFTRVAVTNCLGYGFNLFGVTTLGTSNTLLSCSVSGSTTGGYRLFKMNYSSLVGCASINNLVGYLIDTSSSVTLVSSGADSCTTGIKFSAGSGNGAVGYYCFNNKGIGLQVTSTALMTTIMRALDVSPNGAATKFIQVDAGSYASIQGAINVTANLFTGTVSVLDDGTTGTMTIPGTVALSTVGRGISVKEGTNAKMGTSTLVAGTVVVPTTAVTATSRIMLTGQNASGTAGSLGVSARTAGTSFTITSTSTTDTRLVAWLLIEPS